MAELPFMCWACNRVHYKYPCAEAFFTDNEGEEWPKLPTIEKSTNERVISHAPEKKASNSLAVNGTLKRSYTMSPKAQAQRQAAGKARLDTMSDRERQEVARKGGKGLWRKKKEHRLGP